MFINNYVSSEEIINRVYGTAGYSIQINYLDLIEWIYQVLSKMNAPVQYIPKIYGVQNDPTYEFDNYRIKLPCDFHRLRAIAVNGIHATIDSNLFSHLLDAKCCSGTNTPSDYLSNGFTDNFGNVFSPSMSEKSGYINTNSIKFNINDNYVTFSIKEGKACLAYYALPIDSKGFPMIPDDEYYKEAIARYIIKNLDYIGFRNGTVDPKIYQHSEEEYRWYMSQCISNTKMPDIQQMEGIKNMIIRLKPNISEYNNFFTELLHNKGIRNIS